MVAHRGRPAGSGVVWPSAKTVYALRACEVLSAAYPDHLLKAAEIAAIFEAPLLPVQDPRAARWPWKSSCSRTGYHGGYVFQVIRPSSASPNWRRRSAATSCSCRVPPDRLEPRLPFVDDLQRRLRDVVREMLGATSIAEITSPAPTPEPAMIRSQIGAPA